MTNFLYRTLWRTAAPAITQTYEASDDTIVADMAGISHHIYRSEGVRIPDGWELLVDYSGSYSSFFGACYIRRGPNPAIAFAVRGTEVTEWRDIMNDIEIYFREIPSQLTEALTFFNGVFDTLRADPTFGPQLDQIPVYFTGHSLGAALSQVIYASYGDKGGLYKSIGFENPGTEDIITKLVQKNTKSGNYKTELDNLSRYAFNYQAHLNAINTCNNQFGTTYLLSQLPYNYIEDGSPEPSDDFWHEYVFNKYYLETNTPDQHHIGPIVDYLKANKETVLQVNRPGTVEDGYLAYLDYDTNQVYWDTYFDYVWKLSVGTERKFDNDYDSFKAKAKADLAEAQSWYRGVLSDETADFVMLPKDDDCTDFTPIGRRP